MQNNASVLSTLAGCQTVKAGIGKHKKRGSLCVCASYSFGRPF